MSWALMYHRVVPRRPDTAPYFARGTAVEPETFARQLDWLCARHRLGRPGESDSQRVLLTFDDGYRDIVDHVWPLCRARGVPFAIFPVAEHLADAAHPLWFDAYYDRVSRAAWADPDVARRALRAVDVSEPCPSDPDLRWWVRGPVKQRLHGAGSTRADLLERVSTALGVAADPCLPAKLYLDRAALRALVDGGVEVGGHGAGHRLHAGLPATELRAEIDAAAALLDAIGAPPGRSYCYPDGSVDPSARRAVGQRFERAFTVEPGPLTGVDRLLLPRFIARDRPPSDPGWCAATADPRFTRLP